MYSPSVAPCSSPCSRLLLGLGDLSYSGMGHVLAGQASKAPKGRGVRVWVLLPVTPSKSVLRAEGSPPPPPAQFADDPQRNRGINFSLWEKSRQGQLGGVREKRRGVFWEETEEQVQRGPVVLCGVPEVLCVLL